jgi:hypothetical protein
MTHAGILCLDIPLVEIGRAHVHGSLVLVFVKLGSKAKQVVLVAFTHALLLMGTSVRMQPGVRWIVGGWIVGGWIVGGWIVGGWIVGGWIVGGWIVGGWMNG